VSLQIGAAIATPLLHELGPGLTTTMRLLLAAVLLLAVYRPRPRRWTARQWRSTIAFGIAMAGMNGCFYAAIARIPLGIAVTIEFAGPLLLAAALSRRLRDLVCVGAAAVAIVVLGTDATGPSGAPLDLLGIAFALTAAAFWAGYILTGRRLGAHVPGSGALAVGIGVSAIVMTPFGLSGVPALVRDPVQLLPLAAVAVLSSFVPYSLEFAAMRRLSTTTFGVLLSLEPAIAAIAGLLLLAQPLTWVQAAAVAVVVAASIASASRHRSEGSAHPPKTGRSRESRRIMPVSTR
jgi:inner membrane transporter RhtA